MSEKLTKQDRREYAKIAKELGYPYETIYKIKYEAETYVQAEMLMTDARKKARD